jgi:hypothetical protein
MNACHGTFEKQLTLFDIGFLKRFKIEIDLAQLREPAPQPDEDNPTDEEIADAIMREMDIQHLPREEVLRTVREFFRGRARKVGN